MKRAEQVAWGGVAGLVVIGGMLLGGAFGYRFTGFWAGALLALGQAVVMGLAAWGLALARQARELNELPPIAGGGGMNAEGGMGKGEGGRGKGEGGAGRAGGFRMSMGGDETLAARGAGGGGGEEPKILDTGYQRLLVGLTGVVMTGLSGLLFWAVYYIYHWSKMNPDKPVNIVGTLESKPQAMDEQCLLLGLAAAVIYAVLYWITRPTRETGTDGEAASSNFTLGITGMAALAAATVLGYFRVAWASETATAVIAGFMLLQGLELIVNACRSYSSIEELEQEAVDLQAMPLTPMLASVWLAGLRMLAAQSMGLAGEGKKGERGVVARMMPRVLLALLVIAVGVSCLRVVQPGRVAILERLGYVPTDKEGRPLESAVLRPGPHWTLPWPIDQLVEIPTEELQKVDVGTELHATGDWKNVDFQFWMIRPPSSNENEGNDLFITGDPGSPQILETFVQVEWRVADATRFYAALSHSEFIEKGAGAVAGGAEGGGAGGGARTIYEALIQQCTQFAVTRTFGIHTLAQIMIGDRGEVERHCRQILQDKLDALCRLPGDKPGEAARGIEVRYLTIKDLHPPMWRQDRPDNTIRDRDVIGGTMVLDNTTGNYVIVDNPERSAKLARGPASAFELVVSMREFKEELINLAQAQAIAVKNQAHGEALSAIADAETYRSERVAKAHGEADRLVEMSDKISAADLELLKHKMLYEAANKDLLDPVTKIIVDPRVSDVQIIQNTEKNSGGFRPPGP